MVVPFFEDELLLIYDCAKSYSYDGIIKGLEEKINNNDSDDLSVVNMCFRVLGKLTRIPDEDFWRIFDDIDYANYCRKHPSDDDNSQHCQWGDPECETCEHKDICAVESADYGPDANINQASVIFC